MELNALSKSPPIIIDLLNWQKNGKNTIAPLSGSSINSQINKQRRLPQHL